MMRFLFLGCIAMFLFATNTLAVSAISADSLPTKLFLEADTIVIHKTENEDTIALTKKQLFKKRMIVSAMAFPFPLGFVGAHRVMLGTKPYVPIVYVATLGGCFGLLPTIDFLVLAFSKNIAQYENNPNIFMWVK
jgi:hypothetical protein